MPSPDAKTRLPFIKYLYKSAVHQSRQPRPMNAASILTFHDSVELFLNLSCEEVGTKIKTDMPFMEYWEALKKLPNGTSLEYKSAMQRLNTTRVNLKHQGMMPSESAIEDSRVSPTSFFEDNTPIVFDVDFDKISMTDLVQYAPARVCLNEASTLMEQRKFGEALYKLAIAFDMIIRDYEGRKQSRFGKSVFHFGLPYPYSIRYRDIDEVTIEFVNKSLEPMQEAMKTISLGLDYRRYVKFRLLVPKILKLRTQEGGVFYPPVEPSQNHTEQCHFCYEFVIDSAILIQDFDFDI